MCPQIEVQRESFVASLTFVGLLSSMHELMSFELGVVKELLVASGHWTREHSFTMSHLVFAIRSLIREDFLTVFDHANVRLQLNRLLCLLLRVRCILEHLTDLVRGRAE